MKIIQLGDEAAKAAEREAGKHFRRVIVPEKARELYSRYNRFKSPIQALITARGEDEPDPEE